MPPNPLGCQNHIFFLTISICLNINDALISKPNTFLFPHPSIVFNPTSFFHHIPLFVMMVHFCCPPPWTYSQLTHSLFKAFCHPKLLSHYTPSVCSHFGSPRFPRPFCLLIARPSHLIFHHTPSFPPYRFFHVLPYLPPH